MSSTRNFVIFGATGKQGGSAVQWLSKSNADISVYAVSRDPSSSKAQQLTSLSNVKIIQGDSAQPEQVLNQVNGKVHGIFFAPVGFDAQAHIKEGKQLIDLAVQKQVGHFVFSSTDFSGYRDKDTGISAIEAKKEIEAYLTTSKLTYTILRPVGFLENVFMPGYVEAIPHFWPAPIIKSGISTSDIGRSVSEILLEPSKFDGKIIELSGYDALPEEWLKTWEKVTGEDLRKREKKMNSDMPEERMKLLKFIIFNQNDARAENTKAYFPWVQDLQAFLEGAKAKSLL
ncbi:uncharacterized protein L201_006041 [Kwoniella dendrophila CBS 6074]|uniref:NmrA-like domain-containing protein n=1 Tax=Kwoniella dendrophila CBS 6074 TaxID=1295534 RepID=A0AAX4K2W7_9TREE